MIFSDLFVGSFLGRVVRAPLRLLPYDADVPVLAGPLRGKRWVIGAQRHACWLGIYEPDLQRLIASRVRPGSVFFDIGANAGIYTVLVASRSNQTKVYAFEPIAENVAYLQRHVSLNRLANVKVIEVAVSDNEGWAKFSLGPTRCEGHLSDVGARGVRCVTLDSLICSRQAQPPDYIKMDIEGEELHALQGARYCFTTIRPELFLATHGKQIHEECCDLLKSWDYELRNIVNIEPDRAELHAVPHEGKNTKTELPCQ